MIARVMSMIMLLLLAVPAMAAVDEDAERLRADMEGQSERLRLTVETFMAQQDGQLRAHLAGQDRRIDDLRHTVWALSALSIVLALLASGLAVAVVRRGHQPIQR